MKERNWKYKITGNWFGPMVIAITTAVSGGFTFWLYTAHDGAFVGLGGLTAFFAIICVLSAYGAMSFKLLVDKDGFYFRTKPGNGRYYRYSEICSMWLSSGRETDTQEATYCNFETIEGKRSRFLVLDPHLDAVDYMIERVEAVGSRRGDDDFDREIVITGKTESVVIIILVIFGFPILYLMLFGWTTMPLIFRMIPVAILLFSIVRAFFSRTVLYAKDSKGRLLLPHQSLKWAVLPLQRHSGLLSGRVTAEHAQKRNALRLLHEIHRLRKPNTQGSL